MLTASVFRLMPPAPRYFFWRVRNLADSVIRWLGDRDRSLPWCRICGSVGSRQMRPPLLMLDGWSLRLSVDKFARLERFSHQTVVGEANKMRKGRVSLQYASYITG